MQLPPRSRVLAALLIAVVAACGTDPFTGPRDLGEGRRALFVGNSYLFYEPIPSLAVAMADSAGGEKLAALVIAADNVALIDHWNAGGAVAQIRKGGWEWVVLQQGPSSVEVNRDTLRLAASLFAGEANQIGAETALFSAWPQSHRLQDFPRAIESYTLAAQDVDGLLIPIAAGWLAAWERDPSIQLYADGLHPSVEGAYLSALIIYATLLEQTPRGLPRTLRLRHGPVLTVSAAHAATLQDAAAAVTGFP